jgi:hypothetical protein
MGYEYKIVVEPYQVPELGTPVPGPRPRPRPTPQRGLLPMLQRAEQNCKTVILSADLVALMLVEATAEALKRLFADAHLIRGGDRLANAITLSVILSADLVALMLVEGITEALNRTLVGAGSAKKRETPAEGPLADAPL